MIDDKSKVNAFYNGDAAKILSKFEDESAELVLTSPPYDDLRSYNNNQEWNFEKFKDVAKEIFRVVKNGGVVAWVVSDKVSKGAKSLTSFRQAIYFSDLGFKLFDVIIYEKTGSAPPNKRRYFNSFEYIFIFSKGSIKTVNLIKDKVNIWGGKETFGVVSRREKDGSLTKKGRKKIEILGVRTNIWKYKNGYGFSTRDKDAYKHPAIFPEKLAEDLIQSFTNKGDLVIDPFGGSGTTVKACIKLNRKWKYIEISKEYYLLAKKRIKNYVQNNHIK
jgi:site-specific DNA-methyltransferase (adenine-specific)